MWKQFKISEQTYFIYCNFNENTQDITFILYDFKINWCETINLKDAKLKVKLLNKRFDFNDDNIKEALTSDAIQSAVLEESTTSPDSCSLKLKYRVKNCLLTYEWCLRKQHLLEFQQTIVQPLLLTLLQCQQQIEILADSVRKKDIELHQFRIEGAVLNRKTLVTRPFDFDDFNTKFENCNKTTNNFKDLAKYVKEAKTHAEPEVINTNLNEEKTPKNVKLEETMGEHQRPNIKMSPRQKKRKANEMKMKRLQQLLKLRRLGLEYESSQSLTPSSCSSQTIDEPEIKNCKPTTSKEHDKSKEKNPLSPRKSTRCSMLKRKQQTTSSDDKTDSDCEDHLKRPKQKTDAKSSDGRKTASNTNSTLQETKANSKNVSPQETKQAKLKSLSLLNSTRKEASRECSSSNVFDFLTDSDEETSLIKRKKSPKKKREQDFQEVSNKTLTSNTSLSLNKTPVFDVDRANFIKSPSPNISLSHSSTPVIINEISSQLDNIKKELETLEAMRLADLQQRICKV